MTPIEYYQKLVECDQIFEDMQQIAIIQKLQICCEQLLSSQNKKYFIQKIKNKKAIPGIYIWGEVGVGKTFIADCFYYCLPFKNKMRVHFHKFMQHVHEQLQQLQGKKNPLQQIAKNIAKETCIICFDELIVNDITDAMLLAGLFDALYKEGICLIFTSNVAPDCLYKKGLQRERFIPAIDLIKKNSHVVQMTTCRDYRLSNYTDNKFYYTPLDQNTETKLENQFSILTHNMPWHSNPLRLYDRNIPIVKGTNNVVWFNFLDICGIPRHQSDYLRIANRFHTVILSNIRAIQPEQNDLARSFINLVDVLYDAQIRLVVSAEKSISELYLNGRLLFEFSRTRSRLTEMQTLAWHQKCVSKT
jgi:cell division protein ZapE